MNLQKKQILAENIAFLLSVSPGSNLGNLLKFCLVTEVKNKDCLEFALSLIEKPEELPYWIQKVMASGENFSVEEWQALGAMKLNNTQEYIKQLWQDLDQAIPDKK